MCAARGLHTMLHASLLRKPTLFEYMFFWLYSALTSTRRLLPDSLFFFFNDTPTPEIYTLPLHDALPIWFRRSAQWRNPNSRNVLLRASAAEIAVATAPALPRRRSVVLRLPARIHIATQSKPHPERDRKSTRLNSSHDQISYAVFCLKKKT